MAQNSFTSFTLSVATVSNQYKNTSYPHRRKITNLQNFQKATNFDHTVSRFTDDERSKTNFLSADCIFLDVDNDSKLNVEDWNEPKLWMTVAKFHEHFSEVEHIITPSKSHRKQKGARASRDRFHIYFPLSHQLTSIQEYEEHIGLLVKLFTRPDGISWFDTNAVDCARFFYGREKGSIQTTPEHNSGISVIEWMAEHPKKEEIRQQLIEHSSGTKSIASTAGDQANKHLWMNGWKYKNLVKPFLKTPEIFYGDMEIVGETETHIKTYCMSGRHEDKNASFSIEKESMGWHCFTGCGKGWSPFSFMALQQNVEEGKITDRFCEELGIENKSKGALYTDGEVIEPNEPSEEDKVVERLNKQHAIITLGGKTSIMKWGKKKGWLSSGKMIEYPELDFLDIKSFQLLYAPETMMSGGKQMQVSEVWMRNKDRKIYDGIEFNPQADRLPKMREAWNIWFDWDTGKSGYKRFIDETIYNKIKDVPQATMMCRTYLNHIKENICGGFTGEDNDKAVVYLLYWMADALVNPTKRSTSIALRGGQGFGKGQFVGKFAELFGNHYVHLTNSDQMTDQFNWHLKDNLLLFADEAVFAGNPKQASAIKGLITENTRQLRKLYQDAITVPNFTRVIMASNEDWMLPSDLDDRRFFVMDVGGKRAKDRKYFEGLNEEWNNGGKEAFCWFLVEGISKHSAFPAYDFENEKITTKAHWEQIFASNPIVEWWDRVLDNGCFTYKDEEGKTKKLMIETDTSNYFTDTEAIHRDYTDYMKQQGRGGHLIPKQRLSAWLKKLKITFNADRRKDIEDGEGKKRKFTIWEFGSLNVLQREWEIKTNNDKWSGAKLITNEHAGIIEQMAEEAPEEDILGKKQKVVRDFSKIVMGQ